MTKPSATTPVTDIGAVKLKPIRSPDGDDRQYFVRDNESRDLVVLELRSAREGLATHGRVLNHPLERLRRTLSDKQYDAGENFSALFNKAQFGPHYAKSTLFRVDGRAPTEVEEAITHARNRMKRISNRLGVIQFSVVWDVCGCGYAVNYWAGKMRNLGMTMSHERSIGVLMAALDSLASFRGD